MRRGMDILIVDDEEDIRTVIHERFEERQDHPTMASNAAEALGLCHDRYFDVAILDIKMPGMDGIELYRQLKEIQPTMEVLFITGHASVDTALEAMKLGAYDYLIKPVELAELEILARKAYEKRMLRKQTILLKEELARRGVRAGLVGTSPVLDDVLRSIHQVARTDSPVLIEGETGTGKELVAQEIHAASARRDSPIIAVNCGALQDTLIENELFGHEKGAFTGAIAFKRGLFEAADEGTLFIDEIGELNMAAQVKLLRVLETGAFRRLGDTRETHVDVRLICATNRILEEEVRKGRFREDLFYRLNVFRIEIPPLRQRREDVPLLAYHFLKHGRAAVGNAPTEIQPEAMEIMLAHDWPGNVRELANAIEHATILSMGRPIIEPADLPGTVRRGAVRAATGTPSHAAPVIREFAFREALPASSPAPLGPPPPRIVEQPFAAASPPQESVVPAAPVTPVTHMGHSLADVEKMHILESLKEAGGNRTRAARSLGISVRHLRRKLHAYGYKDGKDDAPVEP
ncbi:MAG: sigma-54-dependent Fis family transcriptional regulator [Candidatus Wallbacteria bacterium]|nr:sigma-54-dependent Fis family transcriptional regulator [Candidatus Wallbacteria bacterium]